MKIALINENSQAGKNSENIYKELLSVARKRDTKEVDNYGMYSQEKMDIN